MFPYTTNYCGFNVPNYTPTSKHALANEMSKRPN